MNAKKNLRYIANENAFLEAHGIQKTDHIIPVPQFQTNVRVQAFGKGEPLLFIPGGPNSGTVWTQLAALLPQYQCLLLDRPGTGLSAPISYKDLDNQRLTNIIQTTINEVLDYFKLKQVNLVGSSFGGYWTLKYAIQNPEKVRKLVLEGCPAFIQGFIIPPFMKMMTKPVMKWLIPKLPATVSFSQKLMIDMGHVPEVLNNHISPLYHSWYKSMSNDTITLANDIIVMNIAMKGGKVDPQYYIKDQDLARLNIPTLWLWLENDPFGSLEAGNRVNQLMKDSRIIFFKNSGHLPWMDDPVRHGQLLGEFIS